MHSCLYEGRVWHRRHRPVSHEFRYRLYMAYLDLQELPGLVPDLLPCRLRAPLSFQAEPHLTGRGGPLIDGVRDLVRERTGVEAAGPIRLLTQLRSFGYYFSPLNLYYCFDEADRRVESVVAEVNNTPWGEQHAYVLWEGNRVDPGSGTATTDTPGGGRRFRHAKEFHVSPFMDMNVDYVWRVSPPGERLGVTIDTAREDGRPFFRAGLVLRKRPLNGATLRRVAWRYPLMTRRIMAAIYYQALRLWMKRCTSYPHPQKTRSIPAETR